ncbi:MAG: hypothetical protein ABH823_02520 [bacterium]
MSLSVSRAGNFHFLAATPVAKPVPGREDVVNRGRTLPSAVPDEVNRFTLIFPAQLLTEGARAKLPVAIDLNRVVDQAANLYEIETELGGQPARFLLSSPRQIEELSPNPSEDIMAEPFRVIFQAFTQKADLKRNLVVDIDPEADGYKITKYETKEGLPPSEPVKPPPFNILSLAEAQSSRPLVIVEDTEIRLLPRDYTPGEPLGWKSSINAEEDTQATTIYRELEKLLRDRKHAGKLRRYSLPEWRLIIGKISEHLVKAYPAELSLLVDQNILRPQDRLALTNPNMYFYLFNFELLAAKIADMLREYQDMDLNLEQVTILVTRFYPPGRYRAIESRFGVSGRALVAVARNKHFAEAHFGGQTGLSSWG